MLLEMIPKFEKLRRIALPFSVSESTSPIAFKRKTMVDEERVEIVYGDPFDGSWPCRFCENL